MRDILTDEECNDFQRAVRMGEPANNVLQAAARLGAERERERAARVCESVIRARHARGMHSGYNAIKECAEAIRRGEEG